MRNEGLMCYRRPANHRPSEGEAVRMGDAIHDFRVNEGKVAFQPGKRAFQCTQGRRGIERRNPGALCNHFALALLGPIVEPEINRMMYGQPRKEPRGRLVRVHQNRVRDRQIIRHTGGKRLFEWLRRGWQQHTYVAQARTSTAMFRLVITGTL
ncbi:hypothetical protein D3C87_1766040 [compost metagenome]